MARINQVGTRVPRKLRSAMSFGSPLFASSSATAIAATLANPASAIGVPRGADALIKAAERGILVWLRQSTEQQVAENEGSQFAQLDYADFLLRYLETQGIPREKVR